MKGNSRGHTILSLLFLSTICGFILHWAASDIISLYKLKQLLQISRSLHYATLSELIDISPEDSDQLSHTKQRGNFLLHRSIKYQRKQNKVLYQLNNTNFQFNNQFQACSSGISKSMHRIHQLVDKESPISISTCLVNQLTLNETPFRSNENMEISHIRSNQDSALLMTNGYLVIKDLFLKRDLIILTGSDVIIQEIHGSSQSTLQIVSLAGSVTIQKSSFLKGVYIDSHRTIDIPTHLQDTNIQMSSLIPTTNGWILSLN